MDKRLRYHDPLVNFPRGKTLWLMFFSLITKTTPIAPLLVFIPTVKNEVKEYLDDTFITDSPNIYRSQSQASRAFYSTPSTVIPNDQTAFAEACYGAKNRPLCRSDQSACDPNARGVQLESFAGLTSANNPRTGMFGGTV